MKKLERGLLRRLSADHEDWRARARSGERDESVLPGLPPGRWNIDGHPEFRDEDRACLCAEPLDFLDNQHGEGCGIDIAFQRSLERHFTSFKFIEIKGGAFRKYFSVPFTRMRCVPRRVRDISAGRMIPVTSCTP